MVQWPLWDRDIRELFPNVSFPETIGDDDDYSHLGLINVHPTIRPEPSEEGLKVVLDTPVWIDGVLTRTYKEVPIDPPTE